MKILLAAVLLLVPALGQTPDPHSVPAVDADLGPCSADFSITDTDKKPVYNAKIRVRIAYGFLNAHKLDLEVGTNVDGKARFTGLPDRLKHGLFFEATEGDRTGNAFDDPAKTCKAQFAITIRKPSTSELGPRPSDFRPRTGSSSSWRSNPSPGRLLRLSTTEN